MSDTTAAPESEVTTSQNQRSLSDEEIGTITRLRGQKRELESELNKMRSEYETLQSRFSEYEVKETKRSLLEKALEGKTVSDRAKLEKWVNKLPTSDKLAEEIAELVSDFSVEPPKAEPPKTEEPKAPEPEKAAETAKPEAQPEKRYVPGFLTTGQPTKEIGTTFTINAKSPSELLRFASENPDEYEQWRQQRKF